MNYRCIFLIFLDNFLADVNLHIIIIVFDGAFVKAVHSEASLSSHSVNEGKSTQGQYENRISIVFRRELRMS